MTLVYKIVSEAEWSLAERAGRFDGAAVDLADGYIHLSTAEQVQETADKHFAGQKGLLLVAFSDADLAAALRWEPSRGGQLFPHVYGSLPTALARSVKPIAMGTDGRHDLAELLR